MKMLNNLTTSVLAIIVTVLIFPVTVIAAEEASPEQVLFKNVNVFNGTDEQLYQGLNLLVEGNLIKAISEASIKTNLTAFAPGLLDIPAVKNVPASLRKAKSASAAFAGYVDNMNKCPVKRGFHTDCVGSVSACSRQIAYEKHLNLEFFGPYKSLVAMTSVGGEIAAMTGDFMNPFPEGKLGVIEKGAYADILIVDGNPLEDLSVIGTNDKWFDAPTPPESPETIRFIMKDGEIYKNTL